MSDDRWMRKLAAFLHDPPDKPFDLVGHRGRAASLQQAALGRSPMADESHRADQADYIASAADRVDFPVGAEAFWQQQAAVLIHPLAGRTLNLGSLAGVAVSDTHAAAQQALHGLLDGETNPQRRYLCLWRRLAEALREACPRVGALWGALPADTRMPDHPLVQHLSVTAAIAEALPQPALLAFSLGPVQEFIAAARRTQDLWMGSYLLSYLIWAGLRSLAENYGPDAVLFPALRGQPLVDRWLHEQGVLAEAPSADVLSLPTLPNRFVALLPATEAQAAAEMAERAVRAEWARLAEAVRAALERDLVPADNTWRQLWQAQVAAPWEIYWAILPWPGAEQVKAQNRAEAVKAVHERLCQSSGDWVFDKMYRVYSKPRHQGGGQFDPNWGTTYSLLYQLTDRAFNARKGLRDFTPTEECGEKCTVCGQRAALHGADASRDGVRHHWGQIATRLKQAGRQAEVKPDGRERLCALCAVKRFVQRSFLESELNIQGGFPSTSSVAAAAFKRAILQNLSQPMLQTALHRHLETLELLEMLGDNPFPRLDPAVLPQLKAHADGLPQGQRKVASDFLRHDGDLFYPETFTAERLRDDYGVEVSEADARAGAESAVELIRTARNLQPSIPPPAKYYAILLMDGDHAGRWLSGTHEGLARFGDVLHPEVRAQLEGLNEWCDLLRVQRLMTPAVHAAISEALANFALQIVRFVVEERHCGRVVYAGGDDVLALLPLEDTLQAARELRALFSGEITFPSGLAPGQMDVRQRQDWAVAFGQSQTTGYLWADGEPLLTMGPTATASIGIAVAHHTQPLDLALRAARQAERSAKENYGRNALCVHLLKRSGEEWRVGTKWFYLQEEDLPDPVAQLDDLRQRFADGRLSMKLAHAVLEEARTLACLPKAAQEAELQRLLKRQGGERLSAEERKRQAAELAPPLAELAQKLDAHHRKWLENWKKRHAGPPQPADLAEAPQPGLVELAQWLLLARFLAQGGGEE